MSKYNLSTCISLCLKKTKYFLLFFDVILDFVSFLLGILASSALISANFLKWTIDKYKDKQQKQKNKTQHNDTFTLWIKMLFSQTLGLQSLSLLIEFFILN